MTLCMHQFIICYIYMCVCVCVCVCVVCACVRVCVAIIYRLGKIQGKDACDFYIGCMHAWGYRNRVGETHPYQDMQ